MRLATRDHLPYKTPCILYLFFFSSLILQRKYYCLTCSKNFSCKDKLKHHIDVKHENKKVHTKSKSKSKTNSEEIK